MRVYKDGSDDSITYVPSGLIDMNRGHVLGYLHKTN